MSTQQFPITATTTAAIFAAADKNRNSMYIRNYGDPTVNPGQVSMWVAFGKVATVGTAGEMEIVPGAEYSFGPSLLPNNTTPLKGYPQEFVSIITASSTAVGCIMTT